VCILDALDECQDGDRSELIRALKTLYSTKSGKSNLKFLLTSRPYRHIRQDFWELEKSFPSIHLGGEDEDEVNKISKEIDLVTKSRAEYISNKRNLTPDEGKFLQDQLMLVSVNHRTYLWVHLTLAHIENMLSFTKGNVRRALQQIPLSVFDAYNKILEKSPIRGQGTKFLHIVIGATRPLFVAEMSLLLALKETHKSYDDVEQEVEPEERFQVTLRDICGLFVVVVDKKIYLLHQTAKEFLVQGDSSAPLSNPFPWKHSVKLVESNRILAERCIWYLSSDFAETNGSALLDYSANNWANSLSRGRYRERKSPYNARTESLRHWIKKNIRYGPLYIYIYYSLLRCSPLSRSMRSRLM